MQRIAGVAVLFVGALLAALGLGELGVRLLVPSPTFYSVYAPGLDVTLRPSSEIMPGVSGESRFRVNSQGMRADEPPEGAATRILTVGGSTTQCLYLDQAEAWPARLEALLAKATDTPVWVGNVGKAGRYSSDHVLQVRHLLAQYEGIDILVMLLGANDVYRRLGRDDYQPRNPDLPADRAYLLPRAFEIYPREFALWPPRRTALWGLALRSRERLRARANWRDREDGAGRSYEVWREHRAAAARLRDTLPELDGALAEYLANLNRLAELARRHQVRLIFMTQPTIYRADLPQEERALLWMGRVGPLGELGANEYYAVETLAEVFARYNDALLGFCRETGAECLDLAALLPRDTRSFYDDVHFNESGAEQVARAVHEHLARRPQDVPRSTRP